MSLTTFIVFSFITATLQTLFMMSYVNAARQANIDRKLTKGNQCVVALSSILVAALLSGLYIGNVNTIAISHDKLYEISESVKIPTPLIDSYFIGNPK